MIGDGFVTTPGATTVAGRGSGAQTFPAWLRDVMGRQGISAGTLARRMGVSPLKASGWVLGSRRPESSELAILADALGVTVGVVQTVLHQDV